MTIPPSFWIPAALVSISFLVRISLISIGPYHLDCLALTLNAEGFLNTGTLPPMFGPGYPATILLSALFIKFGQLTGMHDSVLAVNSMSVMMGSLSVMAFYLLTRTLINERAALWGSLALSFSPIFLSLSTYGTSHMPSVCFLLLGLWMTARFLQTDLRRNLYAAGLWLGLMGAARAQDLILMSIPVALLIWLNPMQPERRVVLSQRGKDILYVGLLSGMIAFAFHVPFLLQTFHTYGGQFSEFWRTGVSINFRGLFSESLIISAGILYRELGVGLFLALTGMVLMLRQWKLLLFLVAWIIVPLAFYGNLHSTVPRFFMVLLPAIYMCIGYTGQRMFDYSRVFKFLVSTVFAGMVLVNYAFIAPYLYERHTNAHLPDYGRWVGRVTEADAVILTSDEGLFIQHYGQRKIEGSLFEPFHISEKQLKRLRKRIDGHLQKGPVYITAAGLYAYDPDEALSGFIHAHYRVSETGSHLYEDWHWGCLSQDIFRMKLYRLDPMGR